MKDSEAVADLEFLQSFFACDSSAIVIGPNGIDFFFNGCAFGYVEFVPELSP